MLASGSTPNKYKSPYSPRVTSLRQQVISGHPATRASPQFNPRQRQQPIRGTLGAGDKKGERRVSEATINHRPPLPPSISGRSQSLDGLLDDNNNSNCAGGGVDDDDDDDNDDDEGASDVIDGPAGGGRKVVTGLEARSLEVLLDVVDNDEPPRMPEKVLRPPRREERSKSVDNYLGDKPVAAYNERRTRSPSEKFCEMETLVVDEAREVESSSSPTVRITVVEPTHDTAHTAYNSEEEGPRNGQDKEQEQDSTPTTPSTEMSRQNSTTSSEMPERKKTFINRLGKRVRSMIKK